MDDPKPKTGEDKDDKLTTTDDIETSSQDNDNGQSDPSGGR